MKIEWKPLIVSLLISLGTGFLSRLASGNNMDAYNVIEKPPLSPPPALFPAIWTPLFILMGISAYLIYVERAPNSKKALGIYAAQLIINFFWPVIFFGAGEYLLALIWLLLLIGAVIMMIRSFVRIKPAAGRLQIPYLIWLFFAAYLNLGIYINSMNA